MSGKVLITGASGFVGFHLIEAALKMHLQVYAGVRRSSDISHLRHLDIQFTYPDMEDIGMLEKEIRDNRYDYIIHAAGVTKARTREEYDRVNAGYTRNLAAAAGRCGAQVKKFVLISSLAAIGPLKAFNETINEQTEAVPVTAYGKSKLLGEKNIMEMPIPWVILRPTAVYGPRERDIFILLRSINRGWDPYIGKMEQQLSFVYVKDVASVAINALFNPSHHIAYNISDGACYTRYELADVIKDFLHRKARRFHIPLGIVKTMAGVLEKTGALFNKVPALNREKLYELTAPNWNCSIDKARKELGFEPSYLLKSGMEETLQWYKENKWL
ncbi:MAG: NAD-dependent epimerase/dehydratase family protein [Flavitalea sp.]